MRIRYGGLAAATMLTMAASAALPTVTNIALSQNDDTRLVTITYTLTDDTPAIVTADICTNGASVGAVKALSGDINKLIVPTGGVCTAYWQPRVDLPGVVLDANTLTVNFTVWDRAYPPDYMAVNLLATNDLSFYPSAEAVPGGVTNRLYKTDVLLMRRIPAMCKEFVMGTLADETGRTNKELTPHNVTFTNNYYMGVFELTCRQFRNVIGADPYWYNVTDSASKVIYDTDVRPVTGFRYHHWRVCYNGKGDLPVAGAYDIYWPAAGHQIVTGEDAYLEKFRALTGLELDPPTEAQWEYACRGGIPNNIPYYTGKSITTSTVTVAADGTGFPKEQIVATTNEETGVVTSTITNVLSRSLVISPNLDEIAWYAGNWTNDPNCITATISSNPLYPYTAPLLAHEVGLLKPNAFGLYDMLGNVFEYCLNNMANASSAGNESDGSDEIEPVGTSGTVASRRAVRGGSFYDDARAIRPGYRLSINPSSTGVPISINPYSWLDRSNGGMRLVCPATIPLPAAAGSETETTEGGNE